MNVNAMPVFLTKMHRKNNSFKGIVCNSTESYRDPSSDVKCIERIVTYYPFADESAGDIAGVKAVLKKDDCNTSERCVYTALKEQSALSFTKDEHISYLIMKDLLTRMGNEDLGSKDKSSLIDEVKDVSRNYLTLNKYSQIKEELKEIQKEHKQELMTVI